MIFAILGWGFAGVVVLTSKIPELKILGLVILLSCVALLMELVKEYRKK